MARYIDADIMQDFLVETNDIDDWCVSQYNADWISSFIESQPTADVVEVVRCSECKYAVEVEYMGCACKNEKTPWCNDEFEVYMNPTDFCSYGERRTDDGNL